MRYRSGFRRLGLLLLFPAALALPAGAADLPVIRIGVVVDGPWSIDQETGRAIFEGELVELTRGEFDVRSPEDKMLVADDTVPGIEQALDRLLADPEVDMVIAGGVIASHLAARRRDLPKPVIASLVIDPRVQGIPLRGPVSGVENLSYITFPLDVKQELEIFREVVSFTKVAMLFSRAIGQAVPALIDHYVAQARQIGVEVALVPVEGTAVEVLDALPADVEAVFIALSLHLPDEEFAALAAGLIEKQLPSFTAQTTQQVEEGILVGLHTDTNVERLARRTALNAQRILLGEKPGSLPVVLSRREQVTINMKTARAIGANPSWSVLTEAELINEVREEAARRLTLVSAVEEAIQINLDLAASERMVAAGAQEVQSARASLLPQVDLSGTGAVIDEDLASPFQPERMVTGSGTLSQVVYAEGARANLSVQRHLQRGRKLEGEQVRLDIAQEAATAYFNLLRAQTFERVQEKNLELTRSHLELARLRQTIGASGPAEVYRWESQIATGRKSVIAANTQRNLAEIALNRILHRPLEEHFTITETGLHDESLVTHEPRFIKYMESKRSFKVLRAFMAEDALASAPELKRLDAAIAAQERGLKAARRAFWSPTVAAQGQVTSEFYDGGEGSQMPVDETNWTLGLNLSFPLYSGGGKFAASRKAEEDLARLRLERQGAAERIEQRLRSAAHLAGGSYAGIRLAQDAAVAAHKNLELVKDAYGRGVISILDLLDAQNAAVLAEEGAANAVYDFLVDLMEVERALGKFYFLATPAQRDVWFDRLDAYFEEAMKKSNG